MSPIVIHEKYFSGDLFPIVDGFYARLLINTNGLHGYASNGLSDQDIYNLIRRIMSDEDDNLLNNLRNCYYQTGFLVFTDNTKKTIIYAEDIERFMTWFQTAENDGPSSDEVLQNFYLLI